MSPANWKGIVLAGGSGTRLYPITLAISKQLVPVHDKPLIYYPLSTLMLAGIRDILIITAERDAAAFQRLLGDGRRFGVNFTYTVQPEPAGIAQAFLLGRDFIGASSVALILGDNIFYGQGMQPMLAEAMSHSSGATIFAYPVNDPERYGVIEFDERGEAISIQEKPTVPRSRCAVPGLYFYDSTVVKIAETLRPSNRGELEITEINQTYLRQKNLRVIHLGRGFAWLDTGTPETLLEAAQFVRVIEERQGLKVACLEEIAWRKGFIDRKHLQALAQELSATHYGAYLRAIANEP